MAFILSNTRIRIPLKSRANKLPNKLVPGAKWCRCRRPPHNIWSREPQRIASFIYISLLLVCRVVFGGCHHSVFAEASKCVYAANKRSHHAEWPHRIYMRSPPTSGKLCASKIHVEILFCCHRLPCKVTIAPQNAVQAHTHISAHKTHINCRLTKLYTHIRTARMRSLNQPSSWWTERSINPSVSLCV